MILNIQIRLVVKIDEADDLIIFGIEIHGIKTIEICTEIHDIKTIEICIETLGTIQIVEIMLEILGI